MDDASGRWLVATHLESKSVLLARSWHEGSVMSPATCEAIARPWRKDLFGADPSALVERRPLAAPEGYVGEVGYSVRKTSEAFGGVAIFVAAKVRRCLVLAYVTRADGEGAASTIADRLALVTARVFARTTERTVDDRVPGPAR